MCKSKITIWFLKATILYKKILFYHCKISYRNYYSTACYAAQAKILKFQVFQLKKYIFYKSFGHPYAYSMIRIFKNFPQYAYKLYAYKKNNM